MYFCWVCAIDLVWSLWTPISVIKLYMTMYIFSYSCIKCDNYLEILTDISCKHFRTNIKRDLVDMIFFFLKLYYFFIDGMKCLVHSSHINKSFEFWDEFWVIFFFLDKLSFISGYVFKAVFVAVNIVLKLSRYEKKNTGTYSTVCDFFDHQHWQLCVLLYSWLILM